MHMMINLSLQNFVSNPFLSFPFRHWTGLHCYQSQNYSIKNEDCQLFRTLFEMQRIAEISSTFSMSLRLSCYTLIDLKPVCGVHRKNRPRLPSARQDGELVTLQPADREEVVGHRGHHGHLAAVHPAAAHGAALLRRRVVPEEDGLHHAAPWAALRRVV